MLSKLDLNKVNPALADEVDQTSVFSLYLCTSNVAIFVNGTELVHEPSNNISTVIASNTGKGTVDGSTSISACSTFRSATVGCCIDMGATY